MTLPATEVWLHHSVTTATSDPKADMRVIERIGVQRFGRVSYSFAIHPSGAVLEGAGATVGAHTGGRNSFSFGIVWIGNHEVDRPARIQIERTAELIRYLISRRWLRSGTYPTGGHRDVKATACPGRFAYPTIPEIRSLVANPSKEDDVPHFTVYTAPHTPAIRVAVDGAVMGFPNSTAFNAFIAKYIAQGFERKDIRCTRDEWDWYMASGPIRADNAANRVLVAIKALDVGADEASIVAGVLAGLSPEAIAKAIPADIADQVADKIHERMAG